MCVVQRASVEVAVAVVGAVHRTAAGGVGDVLLVDQGKGRGQVSRAPCPVRRRRGLQLGATAALTHSPQSLAADWWCGGRRAHAPHPTHHAHSHRQYLSRVTGLPLASP